MDVEKVGSDLPLMSSSFLQAGGVEMIQIPDMALVERPRVSQSQSRVVRITASEILISVSVVKHLMHLPTHFWGVCRRQHLL